jgi:hypothetical protein
MLPSAPPTPLAGQYDHHSAHNEPPTSTFSVRIHHDNEDASNKPQMVFIPHSSHSSHCHVYALLLDGISGAHFVCQIERRGRAPFSFC